MIPPSTDGVSVDTAHPHPPHRPVGGRYLLGLSIGALGVVYGDIGTSPLYTMKECFFSDHGVPVTYLNVFGVLSLIFWSLIVVISIKYLALVMRADNRGEGGVMALMSLIGTRTPRGRGFLIAMGLFGAALLYGDGAITPPITVLGALEGLEVITPVFKPWIIPAAIAILIGLFVMQRRGTAGVGNIFGPLMILWFVSIGALGIWQISLVPDVLMAVNPLYAIEFFVDNKVRGFLTLGTVFLAVTGGEALYADMGHFGRKPIRLVWFILVLPALLVNYFGQGALLLRDASAAKNPFFEMSPEWSLVPMVILATIAACIASQAVISGAFSLTRQAVQLGYSPRVEIDHTSAREIGQIYIPAINYLLMFATIGLVLGFRESTNLAAAYGVAVSTTMVITTVLLFFAQVELWKWKVWAAALVCGGFLIIDLAFFSANIIKIPEGGWFPLVVAALVFTLMSTWRRGRTILNTKLSKDALPVELFLQSVISHSPVRVPGTAVFMSREKLGTPTALLHNLKHNKVLHQRVVLLTATTEEIPHVDDAARTGVEPLGHGFYRVIVRYGFTEDPDIPEALSMIDPGELEFRPAETTYFLSRETLIATKAPGMAIWRERLFAWMTRNATGAAAFFRLPPNRVVELGAQIEL